MSRTGILFKVLHKVDQTFSSVNEFSNCDHLMKFLVQGKLLSSTFLWCCLLCCARPGCKVVLKFEVVDEILKCDHSNESY